MLHHVAEHTIPAAYSLLPEPMASRAATTCLLAAGLQESGFVSRRQQPAGPARSWWQFELIGIQGVMEHPSSYSHAARVMTRLGYEASARTAYEAIEHNDVLAAAFARLLLWRLPDALPNDAGEAWRQYMQTWRPGRPRREHWAEHYRVAQRSPHRDHPSLSPLGA